MKYHMKKSIRRFILTASSLVFLSLPVANVAAQDGVVAKMGDTEFTAADLYEDMKEQYGSVTLRAKVIEKVLENNVKDPAACKKEAGEEVKKQIDELGGEEVFNQFLAYQKLGTIEQYEYQLYIRNMLKEVVTQQIDLSDKAIQNFYDKDYQPKMEAQHILVDTEDEAKAAIKRINDGEEFDAVAKEVSKDGSAKNGGLLSPFTSGQMVKEFEDAVKSLKNGEMTQEPVKSKFGFHVIKVINNGEKKPLKDSKDEVVEAYKEAKFADQQFTYGIVGELIKKSDLKIMDDSLKTAVDDLLSLADQKNKPEEDKKEESKEDKKEDSDQAASEEGQESAEETQESQAE